MNSRVIRTLSILIPLGAAAALMPLQDSPLPVGIVVPVLLLSVRVIAGAFGRFASPGDSRFRGEEQAFAAPFAVRISALLCAPGMRALALAAAAWALFGLAAYAAEAALGRRRGAALLAFASTLSVLGAAAEAAGIAVALSGAALASAVFLYLVRRRRSR